MGEIVNLNKARKNHNRAVKARQAAENRVRHGRSRAEKTKDRHDSDSAGRSLDQKKLDDR
jgi:hypothetical protein